MYNICGSKLYGNHITAWRGEMELLLLLNYYPQCEVIKCLLKVVVCIVKGMYYKHQVKKKLKLIKEDVKTKY